MAVGLVLLLQVVVRQQLTVLSGGYRCDGLYARGVMAMNFVRLGSLGLGLAALVYQNSVLAYAVGFAAAHVIGLVWMGVDLGRRRPWVRLGWGLAEMAELRPLIAPAVSFVAYSMGLAFSLQGMLMVIKVALGGPAVVVFDTMRKVTRLINQASSVVSQPVWVELSSSLGRDDLETGRKLHARVTQATVWIGVLSAGVLAVFGSQIYQVLTKKSAAFDGPVFWLLLGAAVLGSLWASSATVLSAVNKHQRMTFVLVIVTGLSLAAAVPLMRQFGLVGAAVAAIAGEAIMWIWVTRSALHLLEDRVGSLVRVLFKKPI
jgi:O-antigen/teichoic acid export membrane protein